MTIFLKFTDEAEAVKVLAKFRIEGTDPGWIYASHEHALDPVGTVFRPTGVMLKGPEGEFPEKAAIPGYHVNFLGVLPLNAEAYVIPEPKNAACDFAK